MIPVQHHDQPIFRGRCRPYRCQVAQVGLRISGCYFLVEAHKSVCSSGLVSLMLDTESRIVGYQDLPCDPSITPCLGCEVVGVYRGLCGHYGAKKVWNTNEARALACLRVLLILAACHLCGRGHAARWVAAGPRVTLAESQGVRHTDWRLNDCAGVECTVQIDWERR